MAITFISYRREDATGYAGRLHEELEQRLGRGEVFRDIDTLSPGQDFVDGIRQRLQHCGTLVALIGRTWLHVTDETGARRLDQPDDYVAMEIGEALVRRDVLVVPVLVGGAAMPEPQHLPERIRALGRKQALVIRDETWEQDVDRLSGILRSHGGPHRGSVPPPRTTRTVPGWALGAVALLLVVATIGFVSLRDPGDAGVPASPATEPAMPAASGAALPAATSPVRESPVSPGTAASTPPAAASERAYAIGIIGNPEVAHGDLVFSVLTGSVVSNGTSSTLWLRVRASNDSRTAAPLWSDAFQVATNGETFSSTTRFSEVLPAFSIAQKLVSYDIPSRPERASFRIAIGSSVGTIALELRPSGRPAVHEQVDRGDALSRATGSTLISTPAPLLSNGDLSTTLLRVTRRRFANLQRIAVTVRYENKGRYDAGSSDVLLHIVDGADVIPPFSQPAVAVRALATYTGDTVFEVPASATAVQLRATAGRTSSLIPLKLP